MPQNNIFGHFNFMSSGPKCILFLFCFIDDDSVVIFDDTTCMIGSKSDSGSLYVAMESI